jgi:hypothetical protein
MGKPYKHPLPHCQSIIFFTFGIKYSKAKHIHPKKGV